MHRKKKVSLLRSCQKQDHTYKPIHAHLTGVLSKALLVMCHAGNCLQYRLFALSAFCSRRRIKHGKSIVRSFVRVQDMDAKEVRLKRK